MNLVFFLVYFSHTVNLVGCNSCRSSFGLIIIMRSLSEYKDVETEVYSINIIKRKCLTHYIITNTMRAAYIALVTSTLRPGISIHIRKTLRTPIIWVNFISSEAITVDET